MNTKFQDIEGTMLSSSNQLDVNFQGDYSPYESGRYLNIKGNMDYFYVDIHNPNTKHLSTKPLPILYKSRIDCCGCNACYAVCSRSGTNLNAKWNRNVKINDFKLTGAISMLPDVEGFLYPVIDAEICIRCYKCLEVCPFK